ncbi:MAG TPA: hypothetical protein VFZ58_03555 [Candidatus Saccharimonadales bacterium]
MALFIRQNEERSKLQERLAAELQERVTKTQQIDTQDTLEEQAYLKDTKKTSAHAWLWAVGFIAVVVAVLLFVVLRPG